MPIAFDTYFRDGSGVHVTCLAWGPPSQVVVEWQLADTQEDLSAVTFSVEDADYVIVGMGSMLETAQTAVDWLRETEGLKVGALHVTSFRPFPGAELVEA